MCWLDHFYFLFFIFYYIILHYILSVSYMYIHLHTYIFCAEPFTGDHCFAQTRVVKARIQKLRAVCKPSLNATGKETPKNSEREREKVEQEKKQALLCE